MPVSDYDLVVIGTGSGNSIVDDRFADRRVAIVEEGVFGGTCLNVGCIPTKMFVYPADLAEQARHAPELGVETTYDGVRWAEVRDRIFGRIDPIAAGGEDYRRGLPNVDVHTGHATFVDDRTLLVRAPDGTETRITADQVVIAAGSRVQVADVPGLDEVEFHTSDTVMRLPELPRRLVVLGGGYVAAEFAHVFASLGSQVTQVQRGSRLLMAQDEDVSAAFTRAASARWDVRLSATATQVAQEGPGTPVQVTLSDGSRVEADVLLVATGRTSNADRLGLENTGVRVEDGVVVVDEHQRTTVPGIWALGDVANHDQLKHVANHEARVVQHNLLHPEDLRASDHRFVPSAVFTHPQVASVGLTSQAARERGIEVRTAVQDYADVAYGWAMESPSGDLFCKLVADASGEHLLGAHLIGPQASILVQSLVQGMSLGSTVEEMARGQYWIHPALAEVVENALLKLS